MQALNPLKVSRWLDPALLLGRSPAVGVIHHFVRGCKLADKFGDHTENVQGTGAHRQDTCHVCWFVKGASASRPGAHGGRVLDRVPDGRNAVELEVVALPPYTSMMLKIMLIITSVLKLIIYNELALDHIQSQSERKL